MDKRALISLCEEREIHVTSRDSNDDMRDLLLQWLEENGPGSKLSIPNDLKGWGETRLSELTRWRLKEECRIRGLDINGGDEQLVGRLLGHKAVKKATLVKATKDAKVGSESRPGGSTASPPWSPKNALVKLLAVLTHELGVLEGGSLGLRIQLHKCSSERLLSRASSLHS